MKTLIVQDGEKSQEIRYSDLDDDYIDQRIREYENKYGKTYQEFYSSFDCGEAGMDELTHLLDWENLVEEKKARIKKAVYERT